jgi:hypothetical protein
MCIMAYFFTSSTPWGEINVQPQGHVPIAAIGPDCSAVYLFPETAAELAGPHFMHGLVTITKLVQLYYLV